MDVRRTVGSPGAGDDSWGHWDGTSGGVHQTCLSWSQLAAEVETAEARESRQGPRLNSAPAMGRLLVSGLPAHETSAFFRGLFARYGVIHVDRLVPSSSAAKKASAIMSFATSQQAEQAREHLHNKIVDGLAEVVLVADAPSFEVYVQGLPDDLDEAAFRSLCTQFGEVHDCEVFLPGHGLVRYGSEPDAEHAAEGMTGHAYRGFTLAASARDARQKAVDAAQRKVPVDPQTTPSNPSGQTGHDLAGSTVVDHVGPIRPLVKKPRLCEPLHLPDASDGPQKRDRDAPPDGADGWWSTSAPGDEPPPETKLWQRDTRWQEDGGWQRDGGWQKHSSWQQERWRVVEVDSPSEEPPLLGAEPKRVPRRKGDLSQHDSHTSGASRSPRPRRREPVLKGSIALEQSRTHVRDAEEHWSQRPSAPSRDEDRRGTLTSLLVIPPPYYRHSSQYPRRRGSAPTVVWLALEQALSLKEHQVKELPLFGPALYCDDAVQEMLSSAHSTLEMLLGDVKHVDFHHDCDWKEFPSVAQALRHAGGEEVALCLAISTARGLWAVGLAGRQKVRQNTAKLALCVALAWHHDDFGSLASGWPELADLCRAAGYDRYEAVAAHIAQHASRTDRAVLPPLRETERRASFRDREEPPKPAPPWASQSSARSPQPAHFFPRAQRANRAVEESSDVQLSGMQLWRIRLRKGATLPKELGSSPSLHAPVLKFSQEPSVSSLQQSGHPFLEELVGDIASEVKLHHDTGWDTFPVVAEAFQVAGGEEECYCVAVCDKLDAWAVGVASKRKVRENMAKLALAVAISIESSDFDQVVAPWKEFTMLRDRVQRLPQGSSSVFSLCPTVASRRREPSPGNDSQRSAEGSEEADAAEYSGIPRETPLCIRVPEEVPLPECLQDYGREAIVFSTEGVGRTRLHGLIDVTLDKLVMDIEKDVDYFDDERGERFPSIAEEVSHFGGEEPLSLAVCPSYNVWAVGVGLQQRTRRFSAKIALVAALVMQSQEEGGDDVTQFDPLVTSFVKEVKEAKDASAKQKL